MEPLIKALKDIDVEVRKGAARSLGWFKNENAVEPLFEALKDREFMVRRYAIDALANIAVAQGRTGDDSAS